MHIQQGHRQFIIGKCQELKCQCLLQRIIISLFVAPVLVFEYFLRCSVWFGKRIRKWTLLHQHQSFLLGSKHRTLVQYTGALHYLASCFALSMCRVQCLALVRWSHRFPSLYPYTVHTEEVCRSGARRYNKGCYRCGTGTIQDWGRVLSLYCLSCVHIHIL